MKCPTLISGQSFKTHSITIIFNLFFFCDSVHDYALNVFTIVCLKTPHLKQAVLWRRREWKEKNYESFPLEIFIEELKKASEAVLSST